MPDTSSINPDTGKPYIVVQNATVQGETPGTVGAPAASAAATTPKAISTSAPTTAQATDPTPQTHTVVSQDTAASIAQKYGTNIQAIQTANPEVTNPNQLKTGSEITVPSKQNLAVSPGKLGDVSKAIYGAVSQVPDQNDVGAVTSAASAATANLGVADPMNAMIAPFIQNMSAAVQAILAPEATHQSLQDEYNQLASSSGLNTLNTQMMNLQNVMTGTPDDIRNEVTAAGGFATDSQVQALATARNNTILKQYNALAAQQSSAQSFVTNQMQYATADQSERDNQQQLALTKINDATSIQQNMLQLEQTMQQTAQTQYKDIVSNVGYDGLAKVVADDPYQQSLAETSLGLPAGTLSNPDLVQQLATKAQSSQLLSAAKSYFTQYGEWPTWYDPTTGSITNSANTSTGDSAGSTDTTTGGTVVGGIDFGDANGVGAYASDVDGEVSGVSRIYNDLSSGKTDLTTYIQNNAPNSPITADMINSSAQKYGINPNILAATLGNESEFGTAGAGAKTMNPGNVGNTDNGSTKTMSSWSSGVDAAAQQLSRRKATTSTSDTSDHDTQVQAWVDAYNKGAVTSLATVPKALRTDVAAAVGGTNSDGTSNYSPLAVNRYTRAANAIVANYIALPQYQLTANGLPYLQRIAAAEQNPGSISDQDLLDSLTKLNTSGNAISDAQVKLITDGQSYSDAANVWSNKLANGGVLSTNQRQQIQKIASAVYDNYKSGYQPVYDQAAAQLTASGIPEAFWTIPDLNKLNADQTGGGSDNGAAAKGTMNNADFVEKSLDSLGLKYQNALDSVPTGSIGVIDNHTGKFGSIAESEYNPSEYTRI